MNSNHRLVLDLCRFIDFDAQQITKTFKSGVDLPYVLGQLLYHRMGGVAYETLKSCELLSTLNREFRNVLSSIHTSYCIKTESYCKAISELSELFKTADFPYAFLKGSYLVSQYPKGLRTSNDFDVLINQNNITKIENLLKSGGFVQGYLRNEVFRQATRYEIVSSRINRGETVPFIKQVDLPYMKYMEVDINFSVDFKAIQETPIVTSLLKRAEPNIKTKNGSLYTLNKADFLIHLCAHLYKEASIYNWVQMGRDLSLYKFCDIYLFVHKFFDNEYVKELEQSIQKYGMHKECYYALYYTRMLFSIHNDSLDWLIEAIKPQDLSYINQIYYPAKKEVYFYNMDFCDWIFYKDRIHQLYKQEGLLA